MNKEQILEEINKTERHLENMKKMLEECERWKPETGDIYYFTDSDGEIISACFDWRISHCRNRYNIYNCFKTREEAEQEQERVLVHRELENIARRLNAGRKIDWDDSVQAKYCIYIDYSGVLSSTNYTMKVQGVVYCLDESFRDVSVQEIGKERLEKYLKGN